MTLIQLIFTDSFYPRPSAQSKLYFLSATICLICVISVPSLWNTDDADLADFH
jgi:hypothetical protein